MGRFEIELTGIPDLSELIPQVNEQLPQVMEQEMLNTRRRIVADTVAGKTADGGNLKPYARSTIEAIDSGYIPGKAPGNHTPNITRTGQLLRSFAIEAQGLVVRMFFTGTHSKPARVSSKTAKQKRGKAEAKGHVIQSRANRPVGSAKSAGGGKRSSGSTASRGSGGGDVQNAVIAQGQYDQGRTGWMAISQADIDRVTKAAADLVQKIFASIKK